MIVDETEYCFHEDPYGYIMRIDGYIIGYYGSIEVDHFIDDVKARFEDIIASAKGVSLTLYWKDQSEYMISNFAEAVELLLDEDTNFRIHSIKDEKISDGFLEYEIILTGIANIRNGIDKD